MPGTSITWELPFCAEPAAPAAAAVFADAVVTADPEPAELLADPASAGAASGMAGSAAAGLAVVGSAVFASPAVGLAAVASPAVGLAVVASAGSSS